MIGVPTNTDLGFDLVVVRRQIRVLDRPIGTGTFEAEASKITWSESPSDRVPKQRFAPNATSALILKSGDAGDHDGHLAVHELVRHRVRIKGAAGVNARSAFQNDNVQSVSSQARRHRTASGS